MDATVNVKVGGQTFYVEYEILQTHAPKAYDYGYVVRMEDGPVRIVAIPKKYVHEQKARYNSGMYYAAPVDEYTDESALLDAITSRLFRE